ncbi:MAG TPA: acyl carrier protein [Anaerolineae bacterium]|nr:acyl carrier protein [Anaerolineae bacterium]
MEKLEIIKSLAKKIAVEILEQPEKIIKKDEPLITSGLIDSFHLVDLALYVEDLFSVRIDDTELNPDTFDSLDQLALLILKKM